MGKFSGIAPTIHQTGVIVKKMVIIDKAVKPLDYTV